MIQRPATVKLSKGFIGKIPSKFQLFRIWLIHIILGDMAFLGNVYIGQKGYAVSGKDVIFYKNSIVQTGDNHTCIIAYCNE